MPLILVGVQLQRQHELQAGLSDLLLPHSLNSKPRTGAERVQTMTPLSWHHCMSNTNMSFSHFPCVCRCHKEHLKGIAIEPCHGATLPPPKHWGVMLTLALHVQMP